MMKSYVELCETCDKMSNIACATCNLKRECTRFVNHYGINPGSMYRFANERPYIEHPHTIQEVMLQKIQIYGGRINE